MLFIASIIVFVLLILLHFILLIGIFIEYLKDNRYRSCNSVGSSLVSILIPVHNEANRIKPLLETLMAQDYPFIQVVFINDRSTDETVQLLQEFQKRFSTHGEQNRKYTCEILSLSHNPGPNYKQYALIQGFERVEGDLVLLTDADCELPPTWVSGMVRRMVNSEAGIVLGQVFKKIPQHKFFYNFQAFDHAIRDMYMAASTGLGIAGGGFGNNIAVRKAALDAAGGYIAVPFSVTEDAALISHIAQNTQYKVRVGLGQDVMIITETEQTWMQCIVQLLRWTKGGIFSPNKSTRWSFTLFMGMISLGILSIPFLPLIPALWPLPLAVYIAMLMNTFAVLAISGNALKQLNFFDFFVQLIVEPIINTFLTLLVILRVPVYWKGKKV